MNTNTNIIKLPPYSVQRVVSTLSQTIDWGIKTTNVPDTWTITEGEGINILIIDTGMPNHPDLNDAINKESCRSFIDTEDVEDQNGHSTHCSGIVGARNNEYGVVGVAPKSTLITFKTLNKSGIGTEEPLLKALKYALALKPDIISMSLGMPYDIPELHEAIKKLTDLNIVVICAAGNDGSDGSVNYPGAYEEVICVTAYDKDGKPAAFNSQGTEVDISAPGVDIYSTYLKKQYAMLSGTSMATPFVAGVVALLLAKHRQQEIETGNNDCKTIAQVKEHLQKYSTPTSPFLGYTAEFGYGMIDPKRLLFENNTATPKPVKISLWQRFLNLFK